tara:strand:- start:2896 stop:3084 length:189 start_codon:yes stop_codon:yes gene_type:complete
LAFASKKGASANPLLLLFKKQYLTCQNAYFTAAQAAQKMIGMGLQRTSFFTAAQAAQKWKNG